MMITAPNPVNVSISITIPTEFVIGVIAQLIESKVPFSLQSLLPNGDDLRNEQQLLNSTQNTNTPLGMPIKKKLIGPFQVVDEVINECISTGLPPAVDTVAKKCGLKPATFNTKFKRQYGITFYQYYLDKKLEVAAGLLTEGFSAANISKKLGYTQPIKFNRMFQKRFGITPKKYQMSQKSQ